MISDTFGAFWIQKRTDKINNSPKIPDEYFRRREIVVAPRLMTGDMYMTEHYLPKLLEAISRRIRRQIDSTTCPSINT